MAKVLSASLFPVCSWHLLAVALGMKALREHAASSWFIGRYKYVFTSNVVGNLLTTS
jgi:hypothetical protein